jgi:hypothetical protein
MSRGFNFYVRSMFFFKYRDTQCGAKIFRRKVLEKILKNMGMTEWAFDVELLYLSKKNNFNIINCKTEWRSVEESKIKYGKTSIQMFMSIMQFRIIHSPFKRIMRPLKIIRIILWRIIK